MTPLELEKYLVLHKYFLNLVGIDKFEKLQEKLRDKSGFDSLGRSFFADSLLGCGIPEEDILRYDRAIKTYTERIQENRRDYKFELKYFQYLPLFFTEIFLSQKYNNINNFISELNIFLNKSNLDNNTNIIEFKEDEITKLAYWMATGSGKTLIMHINYWQILKYSQEGWDNILLITPNEGMSNQHYNEMKLSGIPCKLYDGNPDNIHTKDKEVLILDIYKLTGEKKGRGKTLDIKSFGAKNLVFIDEGHKGQKSEEQKWKKLREELGKDGFIFEYSATFGQVIKNNVELLEEYSKAILFDYSYKYFYSDGYGKDFHVFNLKEDYYSNKYEEMLLTASLLSYYEKIISYDNHQEKLKEYNIEKPLWIFVGSKVSGFGLQSDIIKILDFLSKILENNKILEYNVKKILTGDSGLLGSNERDIFDKKFQLLDYTPSLINDIYDKVFRNKGQLEAYILKKADGEIALKVSNSDNYFGVINIGDTASLKTLIEKLGIKVLNDYFSESQFFNIEEKNSTINILMGSKKFIEGWNSWRVSNMNLINMGKGEGPQIIQLFGRGVRLKGKEYSLKREDNTNYPLKILQTLSIFGLNADYINAFLKTINDEGLDEEEIPVNIKLNLPENWEKKIYSIAIKDNYDFSNYPIKLVLDKDIISKIKIDIRPRIELAKGFEISKGEIDQEHIFSIIPYVPHIDWDKIYLNSIKYKIYNNYYNLFIEKEELKKIIYSDKFKILASKEQLEVSNFRDLRKIDNLVETIIKQYISKFYSFMEKKISMDYLTIVPIERNDPNLNFEKIVLKVPKEIVNEIKKMIDSLDYSCPTFEKDIFFFFKKHLYSPLIIYSKGKENVTAIPIKLNLGESKFVQSLTKYINLNQDYFADSEIYLLRNLSRKGVGFFIKSGFYPDFIMWVKKGNFQKIIFIDPKGIRNLGNFNDEKIQFCKSYIKEIEKKVRKELEKEKKDLNIELYSFIISVSKYDELKTFFGNGMHTEEEFLLHNILFQEDKEYIQKIFNKINNYSSMK